MFTQPEADLLVQNAAFALAEGHVEAAEAILERSPARRIPTIPWH